MLISFIAKLAARDAALRLRKLRPEVLEVFLICKFEAMLDIRADSADALRIARSSGSEVQPQSGWTSSAWCSLLWDERTMFGR